jgi:transcriptional regulator with XRE-family HTH domain
MSTQSMTAAELAAEAAAELADERERKLEIEAAEQKVRVELGHQMRQVRSAAGLSLQQAAAKAGGDFPATVLGSYERGDRNITIPRLVRLCEVYGVTVLDVLPALTRKQLERHAEVELASALHLASQYLAAHAAGIVAGDRPVGHVPTQGAGL